MDLQLDDILLTDRLWNPNASGRDRVRKNVAMKLNIRWATLTSIGAVTLLSGCVASHAAHSDHHAAFPGPTVTTTGVPGPVAQLADRYRRSGGMREVYGVQRSSGPNNVPLLIVWTHNPDEGSETFDALEGSIVRFMSRKEGLSLRRGYFLDVYGPDGSLLHRLDARPKRDAPTY
jgi:hypothetical protein